MPTPSNVNHRERLDTKLPPETHAERTAFRKISLRIVPLALIAFFVTYIDRANLGVTAGPIQKSLHITPTSFGLAAGLFYVGYLLTEIPSNLLLEKFGARRWIARILISFGIVSGLTALVQNEFSLVGIRVLLGIAEAGMYPGLLLYLGYWYTRRRRSSSWLLFQISLPLSLALGSLFSSWILELDGVGGIDGWRWVFLIEGAITVLTGVLIYIGLPDNPKDAKWLTNDERIAVESSIDAGIDKKIHGWWAFRTVLASPVAWYMTATYFCMLVGFTAVTYWAPTIIESEFHLGAVGSGLLSSIPWVVCTVTLVVGSLIVKRMVAHQNVIIIISMILCTVGMLVAALNGNPVIAFVGLCFATVQQASTPIVFAYIRAHFPLVLAAVAFAFVNSLANLSGLVGSPILGWFAQTTGSTRIGLVLLSGFFVIAGILAAFLPSFIRRYERAHPQGYVPADKDWDADIAH